MHKWGHYVSTFYSWRQLSHSWLFIDKDISSSMEVVFFIVQLQEVFFYWLKPFHSFFLLTDLTMVFCILEIGLPIRWHTSISLGSTCTSMSDKTDMTVLSKLLSGTFSGIHWRLHYCVCHTEPNHYDLIQVWQLCFQVFHIFLLAWNFHPANFSLPCPSEWWSHFSDC